jgi:hypothetical protein
MNITLNRFGRKQVNATSGNVAAAVATATLPAVAGRINFLTSFEVTGGGATAGSLVVVTVTGLLGGTLSYIFAPPAGATLGATPLTVAFPYPLEATGTNTAIAVSCPSLGAGNTNAAVCAHGYTIASQ